MRDDLNDRDKELAALKPGHKGSLWAQPRTVRTHKQYITSSDSSAKTTHRPAAATLPIPIAADSRYRIRVWYIG